MQVLQVLYPDVQHRFRINDVSHEYDFYVPSKNLIIEYDGDYWHGNKEKFTLTQTMKKQYVLDKLWTQLAKEHGYEIHRVWASQASVYPLQLRTFNND